MFARSRKKVVALIALCAVVFAALIPAMSSFARALTDGEVVADVVASGGICTTGDPAVPANRIATHGHCAFCTLGAPLVSAPRVDALVATLAVPTPAPRAQRNDALPRDAVAFHPLSPRAPPRAI